MKTLNDYIQLLNNAKNISPEKLKKIYLDGALAFHPDRNPGNSKAEESFKILTQLYRELQNGDITQINPTPNLEKLGSLDEYKKLFKQAVNFAFPDKGPHLIFHLLITQSEANYGCEKKITFYRSNDKKKEKIKLSLKVPAGTKDLQRLKIKGEGTQLKKAAHSGDLFVLIHTV
ncbi:MAG: DnaJ domain-containing protein [Bdellovibrionaceae bacterium]|jgi:curved DNA-binding protein CbpA|nr:DnaJ domain-containing protein [Pseudobdellovibrionaceae bacterium]